MASISGRSIKFRDWHDRKNRRTTNGISILTKKKVSWTKWMRMEEKKEKVKSKQRRPKKCEEQNRTVRASQLIKRSVETSRYFTPYVLLSFSFFFLIYPLATKVLVRDRDNRKSTATAFMFLISFHRVYFSSIVRKSGAFHDQREMKKKKRFFFVPLAIVCFPW